MRESVACIEEEEPLLVGASKFDGFFCRPIHGVVCPIVWLTGPVGQLFIIPLDNVQGRICRTTIPNDIVHPGILLFQDRADRLFDDISIIVTNRNDGDKR